jgi:hypothetical protein
MGLSIDGVRIFDGTAWTAPGGGVAPDFQGGNVFISDCLVLPNGDLLVAGEFGFAGGVAARDVARWDGTAWHAYGNLAMGGAVSRLHPLPNGDLLAAGQFFIAGQIDNLMRWDGSSWTVVPGVGGGGIVAIDSDDAGLIYLGGTFEADGASTPMAVLSSSCAATATPVGASCAGSGGPNILAATSLPWIGSTFSSQATGMPNNSIVLGVRGLGTVSMPLASILPQGQSGCDLLVTPDLLDVYLPTAGVVASSFAIPNAIALVGQVLHQQFVPLELGAQGNITALTSSNRLTLTIGTF